MGSQHGCLAPLKTFFKSLARENHILYNPASELVLPKQPLRLPRSLLSVLQGPKAASATVCFGTIKVHRRPSLPGRSQPLQAR